MEYQFMKDKRMLSTFAMSAMGLAIAILTTGCQLASPNRASFPNDATENGTNYPSSENETNYRSSPNGTTYPSSQRDQNPERISGLNLTNSQKSQMRRIREDSDSRILAVLSDEQKQQVRTNNNGRTRLSIKKLRSLDLSTEQRQEINEIIKDQRQQIQEVLTPEQRQMMQQRRSSSRQNGDNSSY
jgi:protein CpxP